MLSFDHVDCEDGDVQLVGGSSEAEGTIQVCFSNQWGLISESGWSPNDAQVVCRELGFLVEGTKNYQCKGFITSHVHELP